MIRKVIVIGGVLISVIIIMLILFPEASSMIKTKVLQQVNEQSKYQRIEGFSELKEQVIVKEDVIYSNESDSLKMDIYLPKRTLGKKKPVIFWAHGGAFIAGDKSSVSDYSVMLASQGYVVANINYGLAHSYPYPSPLKHIGQAYQYMVKHKDAYDMDIHQVAFGGDSAGGQIMGQFVNIQTNEEYANSIEMNPVVKQDTIKAVIFFSALLDFNKYDENESEKANEVFAKSAQVYFNEENWKHTEKVDKANIVGNISTSFPPTFLTDGNTASFQDQAEQLAEELQVKNVPVTTSFFPKEEDELRHEYQFDMGLDAAITNYKKVSTFLSTYLH